MLEEREAPTRLGSRVWSGIEDKNHSRDGPTCIVGVVEGAALETGVGHYPTVGL